MARRACPSRMGRGVQAEASKRSASFSTMRFSTGSPEADRNACRALGMLGALALVGNFGVSSELSIESKCSEAIGAVLSAVCLWTPRGNDVLEGIERSRSSPGSSRSTHFAIASMLDSTTAEELAWASYALLASTSAATVVVLEEESAVCARGLFDGSLDSVRERAVDVTRRCYALQRHDTPGSAVVPSEVPNVAACTIPRDSSVPKADVVLLDTNSELSWRALGRLEAIAAKLGMIDSSFAYGGVHGH